MASSNSKYDEDSREPCQFGSSCYRKNKDHQEKFKHPVSNIHSLPLKLFVKHHMYLFISSFIRSKKPGHRAKLPRKVISNSKN